MTYNREVRLGLVLYGGVSLAVYENGIAQEFYRAIRGKGVYALLKDLIDSDIVVDIISGTSAGGVNGIMLAYALATKRNFAASADLWREQADIVQLLRSATDSVDDSILNSNYYQDKLQDCFANQLESDDSAPDIEELDLFVTGTDANGEVYTVFDDRGHAIDVKNHRALFKLAVRKGGRKNDLEKANPEELARLSRLTSCFPVAFEPVRIETADETFIRWGKLRGPAVYLDGGILNNKPFTSTIDEIFRRTATREVERFLMYVEPDPENFAKPQPVPHSPSVVEAGTSSLISIPGYQSIAADLEAIGMHNQRAQRIAEIVESLEAAMDAGDGDLDKAAVAAEKPNSSTYYAARFIQLRDTAVEAILNDPNGRAYLSNTTERRAGRLLVESFNAWEGNPLETLVQYDVYFRMRRASHLSNALMRLSKNRQRVPTAIWDLVNHYFKLYEILEWAMVTWLNQWTYDWRSLGTRDPEPDPQDLSREVWGAAAARLNTLLYIDVPIPPVSGSRQEFYRQIKYVLTGDPSKPGVSKQNLLLAVDNSFKAALASADDAAGVLLRNEFCRFIDVDGQLFPIQIGSGFESTDVIRVVRISPQDAQRGLSKGAVSEKVCGKALGAFGGFFKMGWRANDILVGRLDGACMLIECLLTKDRLAALGAGRSITSQQVHDAFPNLEAEAEAKLLTGINTYLQSPQTASIDEWDSLVEEIVAAAQNEIQREEWPEVIRFSIEQEYAWSRYQRNQRPEPYPFDKANLAWDREKASPDRVLVQVAANAISSGVLPPFQPGRIAGGKFLDEVPAPVLEELGSLAMIRLGKSLLASIPKDTRRRIEASPFYKWPFKRLATLFYAWARMRRHSPESVVILNTAIPVLCLTVLVMDAIILGTLGVHHLKTEPRLWGLLIGGPVLLMLFWFKFGIEKWTRHRSASPDRRKMGTAAPAPIPPPNRPPGPAPEQN